MTPEKIIALVGALLGGEPATDSFPKLADGGADAAYPVEIAPCTRPVAPAEIEGKTVICGTVRVPEDHAAPDGRKINLSWIVYKAHSLSPASDPVVYLHGGPGGGTVRTVQSVSFFFDHLRSRRDIVAFDQRGVDASAPDMDCYSVIADQLEPILKNVEINQPNSVGPEFVTACMEEIHGRGVDISKYNTSQNARDVAAVMSALGYPTYNIYGVSYGTKLTLEVLRQNPSGIRAAVIDGVAPPMVKLYDTLITPHAQAVVNTFAPCERDPVCSEAYPDITARYFALLDKVTETPVEVQGEPVSGTTLFLMLDARNDWRNNARLKGMSTYLPLMVKQLEEGDTTILSQLMDETLPPQPSAASLLAQAEAQKLTGDELALARAALSAAEHIRIATEAAQGAISQLEGDLAEDAAALDLAEFFDEQLARAIVSLPSRDDRIAVARDYLNLRFATPAVGPLLVLIDTHFRGDEAKRLMALALTLTGADLAQVFALIGEDNAALETAGEGDFELYVYACQEDFVDGYNSVEGYMAEVESLPFGPAFSDLLVQGAPAIYEICDLFQPQPRDNWLEPVASDLPVLAMNGEIDIQTSYSWGALATETLSNAQNLIFPESGHGTILFSQCARDITAAFIENPDGSFNTDCVAGLRPPVLLPDGTMHQLPY